jgi:hypothetical protein
MNPIEIEPEIRALEVMTKDFSKPGDSVAPTPGYAHPTTLQEFESVYRKEYATELESCERWIKWCEHQNPPDTHGMNFHQGLRSALIFNNIKMHQLLRVLKQEPPNAGRHNAGDKV